MDFEALPGGDLVSRGLRDLTDGRETVESLLVSIGAPKLRSVGVDVPPMTFEDPEHRLYFLLAGDDSDSAHSRYNALIRRLGRAARCALRQPSNEVTIRNVMKVLGAAAPSMGRVYLTGGSSAVLVGWRSATNDINLKFDPEQDVVLRAIPDLKESLNVSIELASPADFIPELPGWRDRSPFVVREGLLDFLHYDFYAQALSKIERGHGKDRDDVQQMLTRSLVEPGRLRELFDTLEPQLYRYPAVNTASFRRDVDEVLR